MIRVGPIYNRGANITTSDTVNFPLGPCDGIGIGATGNVVIVFENDVALTVAVTAAQVLPVRVKRVNATNTTATGLVAYYTV